MSDLTDEQILDRFRNPIISTWLLKVWHERVSMDKEEGRTHKRAIPIEDFERYHADDYSNDDREHSLTCEKEIEIIEQVLFERQVLGIQK